MLAAPPIGKRCARRERVEMVVTGQVGIIDPGVPVGDLMVGPALGALGQRWGVAENRAEEEKTCRVAVIVGLLLRARLGRVEAAAPGEPAPGEHDRPASAIGLPRAGGVAVIKL
jgi:hypothetical protein